MIIKKKQRFCLPTMWKRIRTLKYLIQERIRTFKFVDRERIPSILSDF